MTTRLTILLLLAFSLISATLQAQSKHYKRALESYQRGAYVAAREHLMKIDEPDAPCRVLLAKVLYQLSDYAQIEFILGGVERLDRDARLALATSYHVSGQFEKARTVWKTLLTGDEQAVVLSNIGDTFYSSGDVDSSIVYIEKAIALDSLSDLYRLNLGIAYAAMEESGKACASFFLAARRNNTQALSMYESENCISWQPYWLGELSGRHVPQVPNAWFPELQLKMLSTHQRLIFKEHGRVHRVRLTDITKTDVGVVLTFEDRDHFTFRRWADFNENPSFHLEPSIEVTASR